jgi:DNA polymerase III subunit alpha
MDSFGVSRSQLFAAVDAALEYGQKSRADREAGQVSLFGGAAAPGAPIDRFADVAEWDEKTRLAGEKSTLGFYVSGHPLESHRELLHEFATHSSAGLRELASGTEVAMGGVISDLKRKKSRKGDWWAAMQLEDLEGQIEVLVFPKCYSAHQNDLAEDRAAMVVGRVEVDEDRVRLIADAICPLERLRERQVDAVHVRLDALELDEPLIDRLMRTVESHRGNAELYFEIARHGVWRLVAQAESALRVAASRDFTRELEQLVGPNRVHYRARAMLRGSGGPPVREGVS